MRQKKNMRKFSKLHYFCLFQLPFSVFSIAPMRIKKLDGAVDKILSTDESFEIAKLSLNDRQKKLLTYCSKIDTNNDKKLNHKELVKWTNETLQRYNQESVDHNWAIYDVNPKDQKISWKEFKEVTYGGHFDENDKLIEKPNTESIGILVQDFEIDADYLIKEMKIQKRRFQAADLNNDKLLDKRELPLFVHPEDHKQMHESMAMDSLEDMDLNHDGYISEKEWLHEIFEKDDYAKDRKKEDLHKIGAIDKFSGKILDQKLIDDWEKSEIDHFYNVRDKNNDGKLDVKELVDWLHPKDYCAIRTDVENLFDEVDKDKDGFLSFEEVLKKYDVFYYSKSTMYGQELEEVKFHDELW